MHYQVMLNYEFLADYVTFKANRKNKINLIQISPEKLQPKSSETLCVTRK